MLGTPEVIGCLVAQSDYHRETPIPAMCRQPWPWSRDAMIEAVLPINAD